MVIFASAALSVLEGCNAPASQSAAPVALKITAADDMEACSPFSTLDNGRMLVFDSTRKVAARAV